MRRTQVANVGFSVSTHRVEQSVHQKMLTHFVHGAGDAFSYCVICLNIMFVLILLGKGRFVSLR